MKNQRSVSYLQKLTLPFAVVLLTFSSLFATANNLPNISIQLLLQSQINTNESADGAKVFFSNDFSSAIGYEDSYKFINQDENLAVVKNGTSLSIEGRQPVTGYDSVPLKIWQLTQKSYTLKVCLSNFDYTIQAYLQDTYLQKFTTLENDAVQLVTFNITPDAASAASDRFKIVFETFATLPVKLTAVKAYEKNNGVQVDWNALSESNMESYEVQNSPNAQQFTSVGSVKAKNLAGVSSQYTVFDANAVNGNQYYRIKSIEKSGDVKYSEVVKVYVQNASGNISAASIPGTSNSFTVNIKNTGQGMYSINVFSSTGQIVYRGSISYGDGSETKLVNIHNSLPPGIYHLQLVNKNNSQIITLLFS